MKTAEFQECSVSYVHAYISVLNHKQFINLSRDKTYYKTLKVLDVLYNTLLHNFSIIIKLGKTLIS